MPRAMLPRLVLSFLVVISSSYIFCILIFYLICTAVQYFYSEYHSSYSHSDFVWDVLFAPWEPDTCNGIYITISFFRVTVSLIYACKSDNCAIFLPCL